MYSLDTQHMRRLAVSPAPAGARAVHRAAARAGQADVHGYRQWVSLAITYDPGQIPALVSALTALAGLILSFLVRRRRVFVRAVAAATTPRTASPAASSVEIGGLTRSDAAGGFETEFAELASEVMQQVRGGVSASPRDGAATPAAQQEESEGLCLTRDWPI